ncbi:hypothetical protein QMO31_32550, partial [Pseudomonas aeruginosa]|nr:hypothetical protein [Pseudomonas aeruginosa]
LLVRADSALYQAKSGGRNRTEDAPPRHAPQPNTVTLCPPIARHRPAAPPLPPAPRAQPPPAPPVPPRPP